LTFLSIDELIAGKVSPRRGRKQKRAMEFLANLLESGEVDSNEVYALTEEQGISRRTLERAKSEVRARSVKVGDAWVWTLG